MTTATKPDGAKVFIDGVVRERVDATLPPQMTRTAWVNYLLQMALANLPRD
jgi:hypothetical protein